MRLIEQATVFKRDYKRESKGKYRSILSTELTSILNKLVKNEALEISQRDHDLTGNWVGYRECHIKPDLLLIYRLTDDDILRLARLGSHSELFG